MTENEAIEKLKNMRLFMQITDKNNDCKFTEDDYKANEMAIEALETIKKLSDRKMTTEVLENYMQFEDECAKKDFTFKSVIEAREEQIAKKPILKNGESGSFVDYEDGHGEYKVTKWQDWVCPICGWFVGQRYNRSQNHPHDQRECNYCNECGQKIDWSDEE